MAKKINVAILVDAWLPFTGGAQRQIYETTKIWQKKSKLDFKIFHSFSPNIFGRIFWLFYVIPQVLFFHFFKKRFTLVHAHAFLAGLPAKFLSLILGMPVVFTIHGTGIKAWQKLSPGFLGKVKSWIEEFILFKVKYSAQISVSSDILKFPNVNKEIFVIPNGVKVGEFDQVKVKKAPGFKILFVGRLHPQKGLVYLIKAMSQVIKKYPQTTLYLVGEGPLLRVLKKQVENLGVKSDVNFKGRMTGKRLIKEYKSSHLFVLPSVYEGQPLTLLEAWAAKLPVLVTAVGENPTMVKEGVNGYLVKSGESNQLARMIRDAIENPHLEKLGENGYRLVKRELSWLKVSEKTLRVYQKVLGL